MPYNFAVDSFAQRKFVADFLREKCSFIGKTATFDPPFGGLKAAYDVHLRLIRKRVVDFPLVIIEIFR